MSVDRYHLHIVDSGDPSAPVTAAMLFGHLTLRCGHLQSTLLISASTTSTTATTDAVGGGASTATTAAESMATATSAFMTGGRGGGEEEQDTRVLQCVQSVLRGDPGASTAGLPFILGEVGAQEYYRNLQPYPYFATPFALAERSLALAVLQSGSGPHYTWRSLNAAGTTRDGEAVGGNGVVVGDVGEQEEEEGEREANNPQNTRSSGATGEGVAPYFDFIAAADLASYDYILNYYQQARLQRTLQRPRGHDGNGPRNEEGAARTVRASDAGSSSSGSGGRGAVSCSLSSSSPCALPSQPVTLLHVACTDPSRAGQLLQRYLETLLRLDAATAAAGAASGGVAVNAEEEEGEGEGGEAATAAQREMGTTVAGVDENEDEDEEGEEGNAVREPGAWWLDAVDETSALFAQLLGVDVLVAVL